MVSGYHRQTLPMRPEPPVLHRAAGAGSGPGCRPRGWAGGRTWRRQLGTRFARDQFGHATAATKQHGGRYHGRRSVRNFAGCVACYDICIQMCITLSLVAQQPSLTLHLLCPPWRLHLYLSQSPHQPEHLPQTLRPHFFKNASCAICRQADATLIVVAGSPNMETRVPLASACRAWCRTANWKGPGGSDMHTRLGLPCPTDGGTEQHLFHLLQWDCDGAKAAVHHPAARRRCVQ